MAHSVTAFWHHFHPWHIKNMDMETFHHFATPNHRKSKNCNQSILQEGPQIQSKIIENGHLGISVTIGCLPGPQDHQNGVPGTQKSNPRAPKYQSQAEKVTHCSHQPVSQLSPILQSAINKITNLLLAFGCLLLAAGGRRQGAKPLNMERERESIHIYVYIYMPTSLNVDCVRSRDIDLSLFTSIISLAPIAANIIN